MECAAAAAAAAASRMKKTGSLVMMMKVVICVVLLVLVLLVPCSNGQYSQAVLRAQRTGFHFQPVKNWMNDPNGPLYYKGYYHLFYQYNPYAAVWGNIVWGHAVSTDLIHWRYLEEALVGSEWYDIYGCWSGSATLLDDGTPVILYTGWSNASAVIQSQTQNLAFPANASDPLLLKWVKSAHNPIATAPPGYNSSFFRDPTTSWQGPDREWRILVGANLGTGGNIGTALVYKSKDFQTWSFEHPLHEVPGTGMWECPDFYPVALSGSKLGLDTSVLGASQKHVLKISSNNLRHDYYSVGTYYFNNQTYEPDIKQLDTAIGLRYDYGNYYASKSFFDQHKRRRILFGWVEESDPTQEDIAKGWSSIQAIPRQIWLDSVTPTALLQLPIEEVKNLRSTKYEQTNVTLSPGSVFPAQGVQGVQLDIELTFALPNVPQNSTTEEFLGEEGPLECSKIGAGTKGAKYGPFGILVLATEDLQEQTAFFFYFSYSKKSGWLTLLCNDRSKSSVASNLDKSSYGTYLRVYPNDKSLVLRILVDHSVVETFGQWGRVAITSRVYPQYAIGNSAKVFLFNNGTEEVKAQSLKIWSINTVKLTNF
jgi:beta-fructofuranosidase